jgi:PAS domain S-box-containing protein
MAHSVGPDEDMARTNLPHPGGLDAETATAIIDAAADGIVVVEQDGTILLANESLHEMFRCEQGSLVGTRIEDLVPAPSRAAHRESRAAYGGAPRRRPMGAGPTLSGLRRDGTTFPVEVSLSPLPTGVRHTLAIVRDVTQARAADATIRRLQRLLDTSQEAVFLCHPGSLEIAYANVGAALLAGRSREELTRRSALDLCPDLAQPETAADLHRLARRELEAVEFAVDVARPDGSEVHCLALVQGFDWAGEVRLAAFVRDLTDQKRAEEERLRAEQSLALVSQQERIARDLHDTVVQSLFGIGLSLQAAAAMAPPSPVVDRLVHAVDDLDDAIRSLRSTVFALSTPSPISSGLRERVAELAQQASRSLGFMPSVHLDGPIDLTVPPAIAEQLVPALHEMLANVARHAHATAVTVEVAVDQSEVAVHVSDNGVGPPERPRHRGGLANLADRARLVGGAFTLGHRPGGGSVASWTAPVER